MRLDATPHTSFSFAIVGRIDLGELHFVWRQFVDREDGMMLANRDARAAIQAPLRVNEELLHGFVVRVVFTWADILALADGYTFVVFHAGIGYYAWHESSQDFSYPNCIGAISTPDDRALVSLQRTVAPCALPRRSADAERTNRVVEGCHTPARAREGGWGLSEFGTVLHNGTVTLFAHGTVDLARGRARLTGV